MRLARTAAPLIASVCAILAGIRVDAAPAQADRMTNLFMQAVASLASVALPRLQAAEERAAGEAIGREVAQSEQGLRPDLDRQAQFAQYLADTGARVERAERWPAGGNAAVWRMAASDLMAQSAKWFRVETERGLSGLAAASGVACIRGWTTATLEPPRLPAIGPEAMAAAEAAIARELQGIIRQALPAAAETPATPGLPGTGPRLEVLQRTCRPGELVRVDIRRPPSDPFAWIAFYREGAGNRDYLRYNHLRNLDGMRYEDVRAPDEPGRYVFRLFRDESYEAIAESDKVVVQP